MKNEDVPIAKEQGVLKIEGTEEMRGLSRALSRNAPKLEKGTKVMGKHEFREERNKS